MKEFKHEVPDYVSKGLDTLGQMIAELKKVPNPCENNSAVFENKTFSMRAFYWGEDESIGVLPNFKYKDFEVSWYKYLGRSMTQSREMNPEDFSKILVDCINSLGEEHES